MSRYFPRSLAFGAAIAEDLAGSMSVTSLDPQFDVGAIDFDVGISSYGLSGSITGMVTAEMGDTAVAGFVDYAVFPSETQSCGSDQLALPLDADVLGFTGADALALINRAWLFELTWQGSEPVELTLSAAHDGESVCASLVPGQANALVFGATITLATGDGVVDAAFPVVVTAEADEQGELGQVHVYKDNAGLLGDAADFATDFGEFGVDVSGYDLAGIDFTGAFVDNDAPGKRLQEELARRLGARLEETIDFMRKLDVKEIHGYDAREGLKLVRAEALAKIGEHHSAAHGVKAAAE